MTVLNPEAIGKAALELKTKIHANLFGQDQAVDEVVRAYQQLEARFTYPDRPAGIFYLLGPTGVGKTRLAEVFAEAVQGNASSLIKIDCSEYQESHSVAKLTGAPPGYVGYDDSTPAITQSQLDALEKNDKPSIVLFDEFDKAHPAVSKLILGILDKGKLTTAKGAVNFCRSFVFFTSNIAVREINALANNEQWLTPPAGDKKLTDKEIKKVAMAALKKAYSPEFLNRLDAVVVFNPFSRQEVGQILDLELVKIRRALVKHTDLTQFTLVMEEEAKNLLLDKGYSVKENARHLKRTVTGMLLQKLANLLASGQVNNGDELTIGRAGDKLTFAKTKEGQSLEEMKASIP